MALLMGAFSAYLMWKSTELPIGWQPDEGPGGGFWPFWLSTVMLLSCIWVLVNWVRRSTRIANSTEPFFPPGVLLNVGTVALALIIGVALFDGAGIPGFDGIGVYAVLPLFMLFYMKGIGNHSWAATLLAMVAIPVTTFLFFEAMLAITLPKGMTEPLFEPVFARVYACPGREGIGGFFSCLIDPS